MRSPAKPKPGRGHKRRRVSTTELLAVGEQSDPAVGANELVVAGMPVAVMDADLQRVSPLRFSSAEGMPPAEMLSGVASQSPTGLLAFESVDGRWGCAFALVDGRIAAAQGSGDFERADQWAPAVHHRLRGRFGDGDLDALRPRLDEHFVRVRALDGLMRSLEVGTLVTLIRGDVEWIGPTLEPDRSPSLMYALMEHSRQCDEIARLEREVRGGKALVMPLQLSGSGLPVESDEDVAADARALLPFCDGEATVDDIVAYALLGRFRVLDALCHLQRARFVEFRGPRRHPTDPNSMAAVIPIVGELSDRADDAPGEAVDTFDPESSHVYASYPGLFREVADEFLRAWPTWITRLRTELRKQHQEPSRLLCVKIVSAARVVGASRLAAVASMIGNLVTSNRLAEARSLLSELEAEYGVVRNRLAKARA